MIGYQAGSYRKLLEQKRKTPESLQNRCLKY